MKYVFSAIAMALLLTFSVTAVSATTVVDINNGDTIDLSDLAGNTYSFGGPVDIGFPFAAADGFWFTLTGEPGQMFDLALTPRVPMQMVFSGVSGTRVGVDGISGGFIFLQPDVTQNIASNIGGNGKTSFNFLVATTGADRNDFMDLFNEIVFETARDANTGAFLFGNPAEVASRGCATGSFWDGGACAPNGTGGNMVPPSTPLPPIPLPAGVWLLVSGLGALGFARRGRKQRVLAA